MVSSDTVIPLLCLVGPTASGKSELALKVARELGGEIINADSRQFYTELNIGTAKPTSEDLKSLTHHLVNCTSITEPWDTGCFVTAAQACIRDIHARSKRAIVVGGTGMYIRHLIYGLADIPDIDQTIRDHLQERLEKFGLSVLYDELQSRDPVSARRIEPHDRQRILRGLEVLEQTGRPIHTFWPGENKPLFRHLKIGLDWRRSELYEKINTRVAGMLTSGLKTEAEALFTKFAPNTVLSKTIGYAEWEKLGFEDEARVTNEIQKNSRHFAKRQLTWFHHESDVKWIEAGDMERMSAAALGLARDFFAE